MAKKFVRGVTGIEDIESYDKTLTNVNDILSDGQDTYVHTKKGKNESYYKLTDGVKKVVNTDNMLTISKDDTGNVSISNKNLATKGDLSGKENTLSVDYGISKTTSGNTTKLGLEYTLVPNGFDLNNLLEGCVRSAKFINSPIQDKWFFVSACREGSNTIQEAKLLTPPYQIFRRVRDASVWREWREQVGDKSTIDALLAQKQNTLESSISVGVLGKTLRQLYAFKQTYTHSNGLLKTSTKILSENTMLDDVKDEFNFTVKINQNAQNIVVTLNYHDKTAFEKIMTAYGSNNTVNISGCVFTLSGSNLTITTPNNTNQNYVMTFSDILD